MATEHARLVRGPPQPVVPLQEVGLRALKPVTRALAKQSPAKSVPVLDAVAGLLEHVPALRLFDDFAPAHSPPEEALVLQPTQVEADSTRSGASYSVTEAFGATEVKPKLMTSWNSKARPANNKSTITVTFKRPEQLTGIFLAMADAKLQPDLVGLQTLPAGDGVDTPVEIAHYVSSGKGKWQSLGVVPAAALGSGTRLPLTAHNVVALRICFKGFSKTNTDKYHSLAQCIVYAASNRLARGVCGTFPFTESSDVLFTLSAWFQAIGVTSDPAARAAAIRALGNLTLTSGALNSVLDYVHVLYRHTEVLPTKVASHVRQVVRLIDDQFDAVGKVSNPDLFTSAGGADPDRYAQCRWTDMSSNVSTQDPEGHKVRSTSSPEYAALNIGISSGRMVWEMRIDEDSHGGECQCFGVCLKPVTTYSYDSHGNNMWVWRAYNGQLYERGSSTSSKSNFHPNQIIRFELDMDVGELRGWVDGAEQGVLFTGLKGLGTLYPVAQFYSSSRACSILKLQVFDGPTTSGGSGGSTAVAAFLCDVKEVPSSTSIGGGKLGKGRSLGVAGEAGMGVGADGMRVATLHGAPITGGLAMPLNPDADATTTSIVTYELGSSGGEDDGSGGKKKKKDAKPSPWTTLEAVVGLADFVTDVRSKPADAVEVRPDMSLASGAHPRTRMDEDEKVDDGGVRESKTEEEGEVDGRVATPAAGMTNIMFVVVGDGKTLWTSPSISIPSAGIPGTYAAHAKYPAFHVCVNIEGVNTLALKVEGTGATKNAFPVWADARVRRAPWVTDRAVFEADFGGRGGSRVLPAGVKLDGSKGGTPTTTGVLFSSTYPLAAVASNAPTNVYTCRLLQPDVLLTGPVAAAALLRVLRLFAREAYKPVRVTRPPPAFGEPSLSMEVPFVVQCDGRVLNSFGSLLGAVYAGLKGGDASGVSPAVSAEILSSLLAVLKGNLRRIVAARVLPGDLHVHLAASADGKHPASLTPVLKVLEEVMAANKGRQPGGAGATTSAVPMELSADAAGVLDAGLPLFFPNVQAQQAFLSELLGKGEGGVLEVHFAWPTKLTASDPAKAALWAAAKTACTSGDKAGSASSSGSGEEKKLLSALVADADGVDPRFERAILLLQAFATRRGWPHTTLGLHGKYLHCVVGLPDTADHPISRTLSEDLATIFESAGFGGWTFPQGCATPEIIFKVERFLQFDRRDRVASDPGVGWVRLYPTSVGTLEGVVAEVNQFHDSYRAEAGGDAVAGGAGVTSPHDKAEGGKGKSKVAVDVFGDPIDGGESESHAPSSVAGGSTGSVSEGDGDGDDDDDDEEEDDDDVDEEEGEEEEEAEAEAESEAGGSEGLFGSGGDEW